MLDLKAIAGDRYRIARDPSAELDPSREELPWYYRIPCKFHGFISPHGEGTLAAYARGRLITGRLAAMEGVTVHQRGDDEIRVLFPPSMLDAVATLLHARKKRRISEAHRQRLVAAGESSRFSRGRKRLSAAPGAFLVSGR